MGCPAPERLAQLAGTGGDPEERARVADHAASCRSCHAALALLVEATVAAPGEPPELERVGRYVIKRRLGAGGMGVVYQASDPELGRDVAIKMLRRGAPAARLRREAQALARLDHRNVVAVHDVGEHDGQVFVAMALVDGETLRAWLRTPRTTAQILDVLARAGRGIAAAHAAGLVHRDLKPDNIFVARDGEVLVGDFGLARTSDDDDAETPAELGAAATNLTMTGTVLGTPAYMAPEQAEGLATARSDQFSFCVTAWEALFGARPFAGATFDQLIDSVRAERFAEPAAPRKLPPRLVAALRRGLRADPGARFPDLGPLLAALAPRRRTRWALGAAALAGAAIAVGALALAPSHHAPDCRAAGDAIRTVWTPERRAAVTRALHDAGATDAGADELAGRLDAYAAGWVALRREVCTTGAEQRVAPERLAARSACLDARLAELAQTAQRIVGDRAADALAQWRRIEAMAPVEACRDDATAQLAVGDAVHQELMRAIQSIDPVRATVAELEPLRARAEAAGDRAAELVAELELGELLAGSDPKQGDAMLAQALAHAEQLGVESARLRALAALARSACRQGRYDAAAPLFALADAAAPRDPSDADAVERAHAECLYQQRSPDAVPRLRALIERSVARAGAENPDVLALHLELAQALYALGRVDEGAREQATFDRILARYVAASGTAAQREEAAASAARDRGDLDGAIDHQRRAVELWGPDHAKERAFALSDLAILYDIAASWQLAAATYGEVAHGIAADAPSDLRVLRAESLVSRGTVLLALGDLDGATAAFDQGAPEAHELADTAVTIEADLGRGRIAVARGDGARGARLLRAALAAYAAQPQPAAYRTGVAQLALARALWAAGDRAGAIATAQLAETSIARALDDARASSLGRHQVPVREAALAEVAAWRDAHRPGPR